MARLSVRRNPDALVLERAWLGRHTVWPVLVLACSLFIGVGAWNAGVFVQGGPAIVSGLVLLALALGAGYGTLAHLVNRSVVTLTGQTVEVTHGPLPMPGVQPVPPTAVREFQVRYRRKDQRDGVAYYLYDAVAHPPGGDPVVLFTDQDKDVAEQAVAALSAGLSG